MDGWMQPLAIRVFYFCNNSYHESTLAHDVYNLHVHGDSPLLKWGAAPTFAVHSQVSGVCSSDGPCRPKGSDVLLYSCMPTIASQLP